MSDLWMILVLLGVSIVVTVVLYNWWQEKKYRKDVELRFSQSRKDVLDEDGATATSRAPDKQKNSMDENVEGWMSEPRVRHAPKFEPEFTVDTAQATTAASDVTEPEDAAMPVPAIQTPADVSDFSQPALASSVAGETRPGAEEEAMTETAHESPLSTMLLPVAVHAEIDLIGVMDAPQSITVAALKDIQAELAAFQQHTECWAFSEDTGWHDLRAVVPPISLTQLVCSLQLADRGGPVGEETVQRFQVSLQTLASRWTLSLAWQGSDEPVRQAMLIDSFCIEVDKAVEFHVMANQGMFHATKLRGLAEACGMHLTEDGRFECLSSDGHLQFTLRNYEGKPLSAEMLKTAVMTGMTFQLDIPTTLNNVQVFDQMVEVANGMAHSLNAVMMDVNRKPIGEPQLSKIRQQLKSISSAMAEKGLLPGSSHARRLFS